jgi:hypothetical protein
MAGIQGPLAVAVNGTIWTVTEAIRDSARGLLLSAVVPESAFHTGRNTVEVFVVSGTAKARRLARVRDQRATRWELAGETGDGLSLAASDGRRIPVTPGVVAGAVEALSLTGDFLQIRGWAADLVAHKLVETVVVLVDGRFLHAGHTDERKLNGAGARLERVGFLFTVPADTVRQVAARSDLAEAEVRVFAVAPRGVATELGHFEGTPHPRPVEEQDEARRRELEKAMREPTRQFRPRR